MIFPLAARPPVTLVVDGAIVPSYNRAYLAHGRVMATIDPVLTAVADRIEYVGGTMIVSRGDRFAQIRLLRRPQPSELANLYVAVAPILRALGEVVSYDPATRVLEVRPRSEALVALPTPFNPAVPEAPPSAVFTPAPIPTPRPIFTGEPIPRRTPIPVFAPPSLTPAQPSCGPAGHRGG
ncbi:MAG: hypothetical protein ACYCX6_06550 [Vulcanimicrobiaceae bacterium]